MVAAIHAASRPQEGQCDEQIAGDFVGPGERAALEIARHDARPGDEHQRQHDRYDRGVADGSSRADDRVGQPDASPGGRQSPGYLVATAASITDLPNTGSHFAQTLPTASTQGFGSGSVTFTPWASRSFIMSRSAF